MISPYFCWSARSFNLNTAGINSESLKSSAMMALPQETILRMAWPQRLFSARKSNILRTSSYPVGTVGTVNRLQSWGLRIISGNRVCWQMFAPFKKLYPKNKVNLHLRQHVKHIDNIFSPNSLKNKQEKWILMGGGGGGRISSRFPCGRALIN